MGNCRKVQEKNGFTFYRREQRLKGGFYGYLEVHLGLEKI